jgi:putative membrane protein
MVGFIIRAFFCGVGLWVASRLVPGVSFATTDSLVWAAVLLGIVNALVRPVLVILTIPFTILTLGLFLLVINGLMIELVSALASGFQLAGFGSAVLAALVVSLTSWIMSAFIGSRGYEVVVIRR